MQERDPLPVAAPCPEERAAVASIHARINGEKEARKKQQLRQQLGQHRTRH